MRHKGDNYSYISTEGFNPAEVFTKLPDSFTCFDATASPGCTARLVKPRHLFLSGSLLDEASFVIVVVIWFPSRHFLKYVFDFLSWSFGGTFGWDSRPCRLGDLRGDTLLNLDRSVGVDFGEVRFESSFSFSL